MSERGFPADAERITAYLRLVAVPLLVAGQVLVPHSEATPVAFDLVVSFFALYAAGTAVFLHTSSRPSSRLPLLLVGVDVAAAGALTFTSGGGFSQLRFAFLFAPVTAAFRMRPRITLAVASASVAVYLAQALTHPSRSQQGGAVRFVLVQAGYLAWIGAAVTLLAYLLSRREAALERLLASRQLLVAESLAAEERERKRLAEDLHDEAIQNLLAARHDLEEQASEHPEGAEARAQEAVTATIAKLREAVAELHPHLLDQVGLEAALRRAADRAARRGGFAVDLDLRYEPGPNDRVLLRTASELLANAASHAGARRVHVELRSDPGRDVISVSDDGRGFDPAILDQRLREGHIGVLSLRARAEALGGSCHIESAPGAGTRLTVVLPRHAAVAST